MSWMLHAKRMKCKEFFIRELNLRKKVGRDEMVRQIMIRFSYSKQTSNNFIDDMIEVGIATNHDDTLIINENPPEGW